jgi:hypothetical protein
VVYERLLNLAVPEDTDGKGIKLEDCLEEYFNTQVDVLRDSEVAKKSHTEDQISPLTPTLTHRNTIRIVTPDATENSTTLKASPVAMSPQALSDTASHGEAFFASDQPREPITSGQPSANQADEGGASPSTEARPSTRARSASVIQRVVIDDQGRASSTDNPTLLQKARRKGSTVVKAVTIPAWQFFRLIRES